MVSRGQALVCTSFTTGGVQVLSQLFEVCFSMSDSSHVSNQPLPLSDAKIGLQSYAKLYKSLYNDEHYS